MSTVAAPIAAPQRPRGGVSDTYVTELRKLGAQLPARLLVLAAVLGPLAFGAVLSVQSGTPADALFGAWVHSSGFALSLVLLGFAGTWGLPIVTGVVAGDLFAAEDRHGTWKTILTRSCSREDVFAGKLLAAGTLVLALTAVLAVASVVAGVLFVGAHPLVNLSATVQPAGRMLALVAVSWLLCLLPALAYTSLAILVSIAFRNGILGVLAPLLVALASQLLTLIGKGVIVHLLLISSAFDAWHGLLTDHPFFGPMLVSELVCVAWIVVTLTAGWRILRRRDFVPAASARGASWLAPVRVVAACAAVIAALAFGANVGPVGVTAYRVAAAVGPAFGHASLLQQALIGRHAPPGARLDVQPQCNRRGARAIGPGDWNCNLYVYLPQPKAIPFQLTSVEYEVSVQANGCFKAQSPPAFLGGPTMRDAAGRQVANPLFIVYGCFNILG